MISHDLLLISIGPPSPARAQDGNLFLVPAEWRMLGSLQTALIRKHDVVSTLEFANYCIEFAN